MPITIFFSMTVKPEHQEAFKALAKEMTESTRAQDEGCLAYTFFRRADQPRDFVLFEQWINVAALGAHFARLRQVLGPPDHQ